MSRALAEAKGRSVGGSSRSDGTNFPNKPPRVRPNKSVPIANKSTASPRTKRAGAKVRLGALVADRLDPSAGTEWGVFEAIRFERDVWAEATKVLRRSRLLLGKTRAKGPLVRVTLAMPAAT